MVKPGVNSMPPWVWVMDLAKDIMRQPFFDTAAPGSTGAGTSVYGGVVPASTEATYPYFEGIYYTDEGPAEDVTGNLGEEDSYSEGYDSTAELFYGNPAPRSLWEQETPKTLPSVLGYDLWAGAVEDAPALIGLAVTLRRPLTNLIPLAISKVIELATKNHGQLDSVDELAGLVVPAVLNDQDKHSYTRLGLTPDGGERTIVAPAGGIKAGETKDIPDTDEAAKKEAHRKKQFEKDASVSTKDLQEAWAGIALKWDRDAIENAEYWARLIDLRRMEEAEKLGIHPAEVFGDKASKAFYDADRLLKSIPIGKLKITRELVTNVNRRAVKGIKPFLQTVAKLIPFSKGYLLREDGAIRKRQSYHLYWSYPLREERYQQLVANEPELGVRFWEFPWSRKRRNGQPGDRYGILLYPPANVVEKKLAELNDWFNREHDKIFQKSPDAVDPIRLAAEYQIRFVALHPGMDGNGRGSRLLMTRILREFGLPPSVRISYASDIDLSFEEHEKRIRAGIAEFIRTVKRMKPDPIPYIGNRGYGTIIGHIHELAIVGLDASSWEYIFNFTKEDTQFVLSEDAFLYDQYGIPHIYHEGRLWPIADASYRLYAYGGEVTGEKGVRREVNPEHAKVVDEHKKLADAVVNGDIQVEDVDKLPYSTINDANLDGRHHLYYWQLPIIRYVAKIKEDPEKNPFAVLCQNRGNPVNTNKSGTTHFEKVYLQGWKRVSVSDVIGQYEIQDITFWGLKRYVEDNVEEPARSQILADINESRRKLHVAGRVLLEKYFKAKEGLSADDLAYLDKYPVSRGESFYLKYSKLGYKTFDEGIDALGDSDIYIMRATAANRTKIFGYRSEADLRKLFDMLPREEELRRVIIRANHEIRVRDKEDLAEEESDFAFKDMSPFGNYLAVLVANYFGKGSKRKLFLDKVARKILANPLQYRGVAEEFERLFVDLLLHASDRSPKKGLSFTVAPDLVFSFVKAADGTERPRFADPAFNGAVFLVKAPREDVEVQYGSKWRDQYEIYLRKTAGTIRSHIMTEYTFDPSELVTPKEEPTEGARKFIEDARFIYLKDFNP